ncbi:MAG: hypothetical protein LBO71_11150 [Prevotellaceae bacterium]|jgi:ABC-type dipeptide/oligopeptide/nickel transport system permease component|nr:hypothetical protein [Prevotellaceae bacterium]
MDQTSYEPQTALPNASLVLVLGILSIVSCFCYGIPGFVCALIALLVAHSSTKLYIANPGKYSESSYSNLTAGKICAWIGLIPSILYIIAIIAIIAVFGWAIISDPAHIFEDFHNFTRV